MVVPIDAKLEAALSMEASRSGVSPEELALRVLRDRLLPRSIEPQDDWERELLAAARPWGVSLSNDAISREGLYE